MDIYIHFFTLVSPIFSLLALVNPRLRQNYDFHISSDDGSQRMLSIFMPGTDIPIHRHPMSNENVLLICGKFIGVLFDDNGNEVERIHFDPSAGNFGGGAVGVWHTVEVFEPFV